MRNLMGVVLFVAVAPGPLATAAAEWPAFAVSSDTRLLEEPRANAAPVRWDPSALPLKCGGDPLNPEIVEDDDGQRWVHCKHGWAREDTIVSIDRAEERFADLAKRTPSAFAQASLSRVFLERGKENEALAAAEKAVKLDPQSTLAWRARALVRLRQDDVNGASDDLDRAIGLDRRAGEAYAMRGAIRSRQARLKEAAADFGQAIRLAPEPDGDLHLARGDVWMKLNEFKRAIYDFNQARLLWPWQWEIHERLNEANDAYRFVEAEEMVRRDPNDSAGHMMLGHAYVSRGDFDTARREYDESIRLDPRFSEGYYSRAQLSVQLKQFADAVVDFQKAIDARPDDVIARHRLAWLLATCPDAAIRNGPRAVRQALQACETDDWQFDGGIVILAAAYAECGQFDKALKYERKAIEVLKERCGELGAQSAETDAKQRIEAYRAGRPWREGMEKKAPFPLPGDGARWSQDRALAA